MEQQNGQPNGQEPPRQGVPDAAKTEKGAIHSYLLDKWAEACPVQARIVRGLQTARKVLRIIGAIGALLVVLMIIVLTAMRMQVSLVLLTVMQVFMYIGLFLAVPCLSAVYVLNIVHALYANSRCCGWLTETGQDAAALLGADLRYYAGKARRYEKITMSKDAAYLSLRPKRKPLYLSGFILSLVSVAFVILFDGGRTVCRDVGRGNVQAGGDRSVRHFHSDSRRGGRCGIYCTTRLCGGARRGARAGYIFIKSLLRYRQANAERNGENPFFFCMSALRAAQMVFSCTGRRCSCVLMLFRYGKTCRGSI